jgi:hypothetical protein
LRGNNRDDGWQRHDRADKSEVTLVPIIVARLAVQRALPGPQGKAMMNSGIGANRARLHDFSRQQENFPSTIPEVS